MDSLFVKWLILTDLDRSRDYVSLVVDFAHRNRANIMSKASNEALEEAEEILDAYRSAIQQMINVKDTLDLVYDKVNDWKPNV